MYHNPFVPIHHRTLASHYRATSGALRLWKAIVKPKKVGKSNSIDQIIGRPFIFDDIKGLFVNQGWAFGSGGPEPDRASPIFRAPGSGSGWCFWDRAESCSGRADLSGRAIPISPIIFTWKIFFSFKTDWWWNIVLYSSYTLRLF